MKLSRTFARFALSIGAAATLSVGMAGLARAEDAPSAQDPKGTYTFKGSDGVPYGIVQIRECGRDMCMRIVETTPEASEELGFEEVGVDVVEGIKSNSGGGFTGELANISFLANGMDVAITPDGNDLKVRVEPPVGAPKEGKLERVTHTASRPSQKAPSLG